MLVLSLALAAIFSWRVFAFYRQIQAGEIDPGTYGLSKPSTEVALAAVVANAKGSGKIATSDDPSIGSVDARVTIVEFGDFGCPYTRQESFVVRALAKAFPNDVRVIYRDFPIEELHDGAERAAISGTCAEEQGKFWEFHDAVFTSQDLSEEGIGDVVHTLGLDVDTFLACANKAMTRAEMESDLADGLDLDVKGTPTFFVNGEKIEGAVPFDLFTKLIQAFLVKV